MNEFIASDLEITSSRLQQKEREYWTTRLKDVSSKTELPADVTGALNAASIDEHSFVLPHGIAEKFKQFSKGSDLRLFALLLTSVDVLLSRYTGTDDLLIGVPVVNHADNKNTINSLLFLRTVLNQASSFKDNVLKVASDLNEAQQHQNYSSKVILKELGVDRSSQLFPLFDIGVTLNKLHGNRDFDPYAPGITFSFSLNEDGSLSCSINYSASKYSSSRITRMAGHLLQLLSQIVNNPDSKLIDLGLITDAEIKTILHQFNDTRRDYPVATVEEMFLDQVERRPDHLAVCDEVDQFTYRELEIISRRVASNLSREGVKKNDIVALSIEDSAKSIPLLLGIIRAGACYLPIAVNNPIKRIEFILENSGCQFVIKDPSLVIETGPSVSVLDPRSLLSIHEETNYETVSSSMDDRVYIIYTSGSTGRPKGVQILQRNLINLVFSLDELIYGKYNQRLNLALIAPLAFDASVQQFFGALLLGHTIHLPGANNRKDGAGLIEFYERRSIDISDGTPTHIKLLMGSGLRLPGCVKHLMIGGEALPKKLVKNFYDGTASDALLITNLYGPTECCVDSSAHTFGKQDQETFDSVPIGKPLANQRIYILNAKQQLQPIGIPGEIHIAGKGVGLGYLDLQASAEKFLADPFVEGDRMYCTGDIAQWNEDGTINYIGRKDFQVKIRGYRVELSEIERCLNAHPSVHEAYALIAVDSSGEPELRAVVRFNEHANENADGVKEFCKSILPPYMIPSRIIGVDQVPVNTNGKVDRKLLSELFTNTNQGNSNDINSFSETELFLHGLLAKLLEMESIGKDLIFEEIGLHSLKVMKLASDIYKTNGIRLGLQELFTNNTISKLSKVIDNKKTGVTDGIPKAAAKEFYPLTSMQKRLFFLYQSDVRSVAYNLPNFFKISGPLSVERLQDAFNKLVARHEALRTAFILDGGIPKQKILPVTSITAAIEVEDASLGKTEFDWSNEFVKPFDLKIAPLFRMKVIRRHDQHFLMMDIHHIISDELSNVILFRELIDLYLGAQLKEQVRQYSDFAEWTQTKSANVLKAQEDFFRQQFRTPVERLLLPTDFQRPRKASFAGDVVFFDFSRETTQRIMKFSKEHQVSNYTTMMSLYSLFLSSLCGQNDIAVGSVVSGRTHVELENVVGFFINTIVFRNVVSEGESFETFFRKVKANVSQTMKFQDYQFNDLVKLVPAESESMSSRNALFDVAMLWHNEVDSGFKADVSENGLRIEHFDFEEGVSKFDMTLFCSESPDDLTFNFNFRTDLFRKETMSEFAKLFESVVDSIFEDTEAPISQIIFPDQLCSEKPAIKFDLDIS